VNHSRFLSSVAFEKLESEMFDASCSAADAMFGRFPYALQLI
jgi:hypothetical protein